MEMHTIDSLRRVHGIDARKIRAVSPVHKLTLAECHRLAGRARSRFFTQVIVAAAKAVAEVANRFLISPIRRKFRCRNASRALMQMTDRQLDDIGVSRGDIEYVVRNGKPTANS